MIEAKVVDFMTFGQRIKSERMKQGISMNKLAKMVGIAQSGLSDLEAEKRQVSFETAIKLIEALGFTPYEFFADEAPKLSAKQIELLNLSKQLTDEQLEKLIDFISCMKKH